MNKQEIKDYVQRLINEHGKDKARDMLSCSDSPRRFACLKLLEEQDKRDAAMAVQGDMDSGGGELYCFEEG